MAGVGFGSSCRSAILSWPETNDVAAETIAVQLLPKDAARRIPANAPSGCPS